MKNVGSGSENGSGPLVRVGVEVEVEAWVGLRRCFCVPKALVRRTP